GPLITYPGGGYMGADASRVQTDIGMVTSGFGCTKTTFNYRLADDFTVPAQGWTIDKITFYAFQVGSTTTSTFTDVNVRIWDKAPNAGGAVVVFGDITTNRIAGTAFTNIYRDYDSSPGNSQRPIMTITANIGTMLAAGTYWVDFQLDGTIMTGVFAPPTTVLGVYSPCMPAPDCNAIQYNGSSWNLIYDQMSGTHQDVKFVIEGTDPNCAVADTTNPVVTAPASAKITQTLCE
ncbi:MAG TPA: hypothetical protein VGR00_02485, partial [Thermoanaerobaculia bacterium]|nr:hypothetical protein [Thermoanaerobaculia bacterium]